MAAPNNTRPNSIATFRSPQRQAEYDRAYEEALKLWPVPYEERYISTSLGETHVVISGPAGAQPVVLFHGTGGGATIWYRNVGPLSEHFRVFAIDTISEANESIAFRYVKDRREFAGWVGELLAELRIARTHLVGNSFGGFLTLNTAYYLPERVGKAVVISPAASFDPMWALWLRLLIPAHVIAPAIHSHSLVQKSYDWLWQDFPVDECIGRLRTLTSLYGLPRHMPPSVFTDDELRTIRTPILLLIGDHEVIYNHERVIRRATRLVPNLQAEIVPNANHCAQYTAAEAINGKILGFLANGTDK